ncbi:MAG TPA: hypothetical protein GX513_07190 [Firmicutes bacterium]|nr:hypothetical protein [Bacillota bacterium]
MQFKGAGLMFQTNLGLDYTWSLVLFGLLLAAFTAAGGYFAVAYLDTIQGIIMTLGMLIMLPGGLHAVGGFSGLNAKLAAINPGLVDWVGFMPKSLLIGLTVLYVVSFWGQPHLAARFYTLRDKTAVRLSFPISQALTTFWMLSGCIIGLVARVLWPNLKTGDLAMPVAIQNLLGVAGIVVWLALLSAIFSTVDSLLLVVGTNVSHDIIKGYIWRGMSDRTELIVSKLACFVICAIALVLALNPAPLITIVHSISMGAFAIFLGIPLAIGVFWRRANAAGAAVAVTGGPIIYLLWKLFLVKPTGLHEMVGSLLVTVPLLVLVTLATSPPAEREVQRFFASAD